MKKPALSNAARELFSEKYPQIEFLLRLTEEKKIQELSPQVIGEKIFKESPKLLVFTSVQVLKEAKIFSYLEKHLDAKIIVLEKELESFFWLFKQDFAKEVISHSQIEFYYLLEDQTQEEVLRQILFKYPTDEIFLYPESDTLKISALRNATLSSSYDREDQYYHLLFRNLCKNFKKLSSHFYADDLRGAFEGIPAIICGAGPSLTKEIPFLEKCANKALILAGGSTISALTVKGLNPHIGLALDPNPEEYERLYPGNFFDMPLLYTPRLQPEVFSLFNGKSGYLRTASGGLFQKLLEEKCELQKPSLQEGLTEDAMSVTTMAISAATHFGCNPILFLGIDLAYTGGKAYAEGVVDDPSALFKELKEDTRASERLSLKENTKGKLVYTNTKWIMESNAISSFAKRYPQTQFFDCNEEGLGFPGIEKICFQEVADTYFLKEYDLKNKVHLEIENAESLLSKKDAVENFFASVYESILQSIVLVKKTLDLLEDETKTASARSTYLLLNELDLDEELAFSCFLKQVKSKRGERVKYEYFLTLLEHYKNIFEARLKT